MVRRLNRKFSPDRKRCQSFSQPPHAAMAVHRHSVPVCGGISALSDVSRVVLSFAFLTCDVAGFWCPGGTDQGYQP